MLPATEVEAFEKEVKRYKKNFYDEVEKKYCETTKRKIEDAKQNHVGLGDLFKEYEYPHPDDLRDRYIFDYDMGIVNEFNHKDIRVAISEVAKSNIIANHIEGEETVKQNADKHTAKQLVSSIERLASGLEKFDPKNKTKNPLRDSSYNELRDMLDSIDQYLLGDDDDLRSTVADLRKDIIGAKSQDNLKKDDKARKSTAKKLRQAEKEGQSF